MNAEIYAEGGGPQNERPNIECRQAFQRLLENCGLDSERFTVFACGGRGDAWNDFQVAHEDADGAYYVAMLIDSERPVDDIERTWAHLESGRDNWTRPPNAQDDQVLFMTTCMETWIAADRETLQEHFGAGFRSDDLPELDDLEERRPGFMNAGLESATQACSTQYSKGGVSFQILGKLNPNALERRLPSFRRARRILEAKLG